MEIERKWMVDGWPEAPAAMAECRMRQGYFSVRPTVRIRQEAWQGGETEYVLCFKGAPSAGGLAREEIEHRIDPALFAQLEGLLGLPLIEKVQRRYPLPGGLTLEVNEVDAGQPTAFWYAEVEFASLAEADAWQPPAPLTGYLAHEVTGQPGQSMGEYWLCTRGQGVEGGVTAP